MKITEFSLPKKLQLLQNKLLKLRNTEKLFLQNGDLGCASAPSNIALIKYWGKNKTAFQEPDNSSLSFTLENFRATTTVCVLGRFFPQNEFPNYIPNHEFYLTDSVSNKINTTLPPKLSFFLSKILSPFATDIGLKIESSNNFPTACGLASSAAGIAALCFALDDLFNLKKHFTPQERQYWISQWARLGSGSALRSTSLEPNSKFVSWEICHSRTASKKGMSQPASEMKNIEFHSRWNALKHCVFVIDSTEKNITSSEGHQFAATSPLHAIRISYVNENFETFKTALKNFDFDFVAHFTEQDALNMHATMLTGNPKAEYLSTKTSMLIAAFVSFRQKTQFKGFWTLDAGPNLHILYLEDQRKLLLKFHKLMSNSLHQPIQIYE